MFTVEKHIWRTDDGRLVEHGDPDAAALAYPAGTEMTNEQAKRLGLLGAESKTPPAEAKSEAKAEPKAAPARKAVPKPGDK